jgi:hypothetical protein
VYTTDEPARDQRGFPLLPDPPLMPDLPTLPDPSTMFRTPPLLPGEDEDEKEDEDDR